MTAVTIGVERRTRAGCTRHRVVLGNERLAEPVGAVVDSGVEDGQPHAGADRAQPGATSVGGMQMPLPRRIGTVGIKRIRRDERRGGLLGEDEIEWLATSIPGRPAISSAQSIGSHPVGTGTSNQPSPTSSLPVASVRAMAAGAAIFTRMCEGSCGAVSSLACPSLARRRRLFRGHRPQVREEHG